jgi:hypothetical protein
VEVKNRVIKNGLVEIISRDGPPRKNRVLRIITDADFDAAAAQPNTRASLMLETPDACVPGDILRAS